MGRPRHVERVKCVHCKIKNQTKARGLCWRCYQTPGIRRLYAVKFKIERGHGTGIMKSRGVDQAPTNDLPASDARIKTFERRARLGLDIHHPKDAQFSLK